ncbi:hypothetical protein AMK59_3053, partial [Oryctes borbonicus]
GERLESKPGGECQVCYCRGGEVQCTEVSCYIRTDCEGKTVPGQCCPKYEHCPAIEPTSGKISPKPEVEEHETTTKTSFDPATNSSLENEIGETTLPIEKEENLVSIESTTILTIEKLNLKEQITQTEDLADINTSKITIHEIIPEIKEIPITEPPKQENASNVQGQLLVEEKVPTINEENHINDVEDDATLESSELSEVFQHPPPVLRIGDQLLFLKKGELVPEKDASTPSPVFTIIGAEGLQRGDIESMEHHEIPKEIETSPVDIPKSSVESEINTEDRGKVEIKVNPNDGAENIDKTVKEASTTLPVGNSPADTLITDASQKESTAIANENTLKIDNTTIDVAVELATGDFEKQNQEVDIKSDSPPVTLIEITSTTKKPTEEEQKIKIEEIVQLENPAYPPIPEIMSQQGAEYIDHNVEIVENTSKDTLENIEISTVDTKILPEVLPFRRNGTEFQNATHASWLKSDESETLVNEKAALPDEILEKIAPSDLTDLTTNAAIDVTTENSSPKPGKRSSDLGAEDVFPIEGFRDDDLLRYGTIVEKDPLVENQVKKLAADDGDLLSSASSLPQERSRSTETLENSSGDLSGEYTTPKGIFHASVMTSSEGASVEGYLQDNTKEASSSEEKTKNDGDVEMIDPALLSLNSSKTNLTHDENSKELHQDRVESSSEEKTKNEGDVEMIDPALLSLNSSKNNLTHDENSKELHQDRVEKRTINRKYDPESDKIFQELNTELHLLDGDYVNNKNDEEEKKEAEIIFKELLDEVNSSTSKTPQKSGNGNSDSVVLQRVSDAIAKFQLKEARQSLDVGILGILRDFFTSQYKSYKDV